MLQDVEAGRALETEALIGSILEMARITNTPAPLIEAVYACTKLLNQTLVRTGSGVRVTQGGLTALVSNWHGGGSKRAVLLRPR